MSLCRSRSCGCSLTSSTLKMATSGGRTFIDHPGLAEANYPIFRFLNVAERDAELPSPQEGMEAFTTIDKTKYRYINGAWILMNRPVTSYVVTNSGIVVGAGGTASHNYMVANGLVVVWWDFTLGSSGFSVLYPYVPLPFPVKAPSITRLDGIVAYYDASAGVIYSGTATVESPGSPALFRADGGAGGFGVHGTNPFTWAATDEIWGQIQYSIY